MLGVVAPEAWGWSDRVFDWTIGMGLYGFVSGVGFGSLLSLREGRKTVLGIPLRRAAIWGVVGSAAVPLLFGALGTFPAGTTATEIVSAMLVTGVLGGTFAPAAIAMARRAELQAEEERRLLS